MSRTLEEALAAVKQLYPPGSEDLYDWDTRTAWVTRELRVVARAVLATWGQQEKLRRELNPAQAVELLDGWERLMGLAPGWLTLAQRQQRMVARWRQHGPASPGNLLLLLSTVSGPTQPTIMETSRSAVTERVWRDLQTFPAVAASGVTNLVIGCADNAPASNAGARVAFRLTHPSVEDLSVKIIAPSGAQSPSMRVGLGAAVAQDFCFRWKGAAGEVIDGDWTIRITNSGASAGSIDDPAGDGISGILVEGIGRGVLGAQGLASAIFRWAALVDESLTTPQIYSRQDFKRELRRSNPAHCEGNLALVNSSGGAAGLWDDDAKGMWDGLIWGA